MGLLLKEKIQSGTSLGKENMSLIETISIRKGELFQKIQTETMIAFLSKGKINFTGELIPARIIAEGQILFLPLGELCEITALQDSRFLVFRLTSQMYLFENFNIEGLHYRRGDFDEEFNPLEMREELADYIKDLLLQLNRGLNIHGYLEGKIKELFYLLYTYYSKKEIAGLFCPLLSRDTDFSTFVLANYMEVKTVGEFAERAHLSLSAFEKTFRKTFGMPAYQWMKQRKVKRLFYEITTTSKPLKQVSDECGFPSQSQFNDFCKKNFGLPPGKMRKQAK